MRARWMTAAVAVMFPVAAMTAHPSGVVAAATVLESGQASSGAHGLAGAWVSEPDRMRLVTDLDTSVWGEGATSERIVELRLEGSGEGLLTVSRKVVGPEGETKGASESVEAVRLRVGAPTGTRAGRIEHAVEVLEAERRYPDDPEYRWPLEGVRVRVIGFEDRTGEIEIRFDTPEGRGSFWETLKRQ